MDFFNLIATTVKSERTKRNITQQQLGDKCGISKSDISRFENANGNPRLETIERIFRALEIKAINLEIEIIK